MNRLMRLSRQRERATAKELGGRTTPGSGNVRNIFLKEDVHTATTILQHKLTEKGSFILKKEEFEKTVTAALRQVKTPVWKIEIQDRHLAVLRWEDYRQMLADAGYENPK
jgi:hypothetical protein